METGLLPAGMLSISAGRKTDTQDAEWIAQALGAGLLPPFKVRQPPFVSRFDGGVAVRVRAG